MGRAYWLVDDSVNEMTFTVDDEAVATVAVVATIVKKNRTEWTMTSCLKTKIGVMITFTPNHVEVQAWLSKSKKFCFFQSKQAAQQRASATYARDRIALNI
jgi:hypothetical protein